MELSPGDDDGLEISTTFVFRNQPRQQPREKALVPLFLNQADEVARAGKTLTSRLMLIQPVCLPASDRRAIADLPSQRRGCQVNRAGSALTVFAMSSGCT